MTFPPFLRRLAPVRSAVRALWVVEGALAPMSAQAYFEGVLRDPRYDEPKRLHRHGYRIYSKEFEDGMIREIFRRIGARSRRFVEIGAADGLENNTAALLLEGWSGLWLEGDRALAAAARAGLPRLQAAGRLAIDQALVSPGNVDGLIALRGFGGEIDLLSIDIDGPDLAVIEALTIARPRVVVAEYNAAFPPHLRFAAPPDHAAAWAGTDFYGASLRTLTEAMDRRGFALVGCNLVGCNAFFVRADEARDRFLAPFTPEIHYEPERLHAGRLLRRGHRADHRTLDHAGLMAVAEGAGDRP